MADHYEIEQPATVDNLIAVLVEIKEARGGALPVQVYSECGAVQPSAVTVFSMGKGKGVGVEIA